MAQSRPLRRRLPEQRLSPLLSKWSQLKSWFLYSETIFLARAAAAAGAITTAVGGFDFSPMWDLFKTGTDFTRHQIIWIGVAILGSGITMELARRRNATDFTKLTS